MLNDSIFEAIQWAHRYCIDYAVPCGDTATTEKFVHDFISHWGQYMSQNQIERLLIDVNRFKAEQRDGVPEIVDEYIEFLKEYDYEWPDTEKECAGPANPFDMVLYASKYCITRKSYAAGYAHDVVKFTKSFTEKDIMKYSAWLHDYIESAEKRWNEIKDNPEYSWARRYDIVPDECWYDLESYLCSEHYVVIAQNVCEQLTVECFVDRDGLCRPCDSYLRNPYVKSWVDSRYIIKSSTV